MCVSGRDDYIQSYELVVQVEGESEYYQNMVKGGVSEKFMRDAICFIFQCNTLVQS